METTSTFDALAVGDLFKFNPSHSGMVKKVSATESALVDWRYNKLTQRGTYVTVRNTRMVVDPVRVVYL